MSRIASICFLLCWAASVATAQTVSMRIIERSAPGDRRGVVGVGPMDTAGLRFTATPGLPFTAVVPVEGRPVELRFTPASVRAKNYTLLVQGDDGALRRAEPGPVTTYAGSTPELPGLTAAASLTPEGIAARIAVPNLRGSYWVQPSSDNTGAIEGERAHDAYHTADVHLSPEGCDAEVFPAAPRRSSELRAACNAPVCVAQIACDADYEFYQSLGGSVAAVEAYIERTVAQMNLQYISEVGIRHEITAIVVRTSAMGPYNTTNPGGLLIQMQNEWNTNLQAVPRDVAQLFTGRILGSGASLGIAITGTMCDTTQAYSLVRSRCCGSVAVATDLSAHELGHNWGATHCPCSAPNPFSTMNAAITGANSFVTDVSGASVASILATRASAQCLEPDTPSTPPDRPTLISPAAGSFGVPLPIVLSWNPVPGADFYVGILSLNPDLSNPLVSQATFGTSVEIQGTLNSLGARYYWGVEAWNSHSQRVTSVPAVAPFITQIPPNDCPGDYNNDRRVDSIDLAIVLAGFGREVTLPGTQGDLNGDGVVTTVDLPGFLSRFGALCP